MLRRAIFIILIVCLTNCSLPKPDYSLFLTNRPTSILIFQPLNSTASVDAPEKFMSTVSEAVAEQGYYVFPVALVDRLLKENGVITPIEMRQVSRAKLQEIFKADALLDITIEEWGTSYVVFNSTTTVKLHYKLIDLHSGGLLWEYSWTVVDSSNNGSNDFIAVLAGSLVHAISGAAGDPEVGLSYQANNQALMHDQVGLLSGPRAPVDPS